MTFDAKWLYERRVERAQRRASRKRTWLTIQGISLTIVCGILALAIVAILLSGCNTATPTATETPSAQVTPNPSTSTQAVATPTANAVAYIMDCAVLVTVNGYKSSDLGDTVIRVYRGETYLGVTTMHHLMECVR